MQFSRRFLIAAVCTLGMLVGTSAVQAQQTKVLPNDTELIITINLQQIFKSEVLKDKKEIVDAVKGKVTESLDDKGVAKYLKKADFDLFRDLSSITIASPVGRDPKQAFILIEGNFDADKIEAAATDAGNDAGGGLKVIRIGTAKAFEVTPKDEKAMYFGVLNKKTMIVASTKEDFADAVARFSGSKQSSLKAEVKGLMDTVNNKQSISVIATSAIIAKMAENAPEGAGDKVKIATAGLQQLEGVSLAITIEKNIDFLVGVNAKDNKTAADFAAKGNLAVGFAKLSVAEKAKQDEKFAMAMEVLNTIRLTSMGSNLVVRGQISYETLGKVLQNLPIPGN